MKADDLLRRAEELKARVDAAAERGDYDYAMQHDILRLENLLAELGERVDRIERAIGLADT